MTFMPPHSFDDPAAEYAKAQKIVEEVVKSLWGQGVFATEMFLLENGKFLRNNTDSG